MNRTHRWAGLAAATALLALAAAPAQAANAPDCPNGGVVRFGVEPYDTSASWCRSTTTSARSSARSSAAR